MYSFTSRDVGSLSSQVLRHLMKAGQREDSRNGPVLVYTEPVATELMYPYYFMYDDRIREANPFFHIVEFFHMIAGRNDLDSLAFFNSGMRQYSDDGKTIMGSAYGYRWRNYFGKDQIEYAVQELSKNPDSRRVVLSHWDSAKDLGRNSKDIPCNTEILLRCVPGEKGRRFNISVINRSNDLVYGTFGANVVHFSMFHHYMAALLDMVPGSYWQISNNSHLYLENDRSKQVMEWIAQGGALQTAYSEDDTDGFVYFHNLLSGFSIEERWNFDAELMILIDSYFDTVHNVSRLPDRNHLGYPLAGKVMTDILRPVINAYRWYKVKDFPSAIECAEEIKVGIFRVACINWLKRRMEK